MKSHVTKAFNDLYAQLPLDAQRQADEAYALFQRDPNHPSLHFKPMKGHQHTYSVRIGLRYRALAREYNGELYWYWIGTHADYDKLV